jgi:hypothetical protein
MDRERFRIEAAAATRALGSRGTIVDADEIDGDNGVARTGA